MSWQELPTIEYTYNREMTVIVQGPWLPVPDFCTPGACLDGGGGGRGVRAILSPLLKRKPVFAKKKKKQ